MKGQDTKGKVGGTPVAEAQAAPMPDLEALASNTARLMEEMGKATAAALKPVEEGRAKPASAKRSATS